MISQRAFARSLRIEKSLIACDEVQSYGCIADVLAIDTRKKEIIEYEFKNNSHDLKVAEKKKSKYRLQRRAFRGCYGHVLPNGKHINKSLGVYKEPQKPHKFYFVVTEELYEKEKEYLSSRDSHCGVVVYCENNNKYSVMKRCFARKSNLQKYNVVVKALLVRLANVYTWDTK